jgi:hypothetical protein
MKKSIFISLIFIQSLIAQDNLPATTAIDVVADDPEIKNLEWNRYVTNNFTILSIDDKKGKEISENIESIKASALIRWGFPDVKFNKECRVFCVPNYSLLKKLFNINTGKVQLRKEINVIWCIGDDKPSRSLLPFVTQVCLSEYETSKSTVLPFWFKRGCIAINNSIPDVKDLLKSFNDVARKEQFTYSSEQMFTVVEDDYNKQNTESKKIFDQQAACLCLMLRKEFGEAKLQGFIRLQIKNKPEDVLRLIYGFSSFSNFDKQYVRYMKDLCSDIVDEKTPDSYLEIKPSN